MNYTDSSLPPPPSHICLLSSNMSELSFNDNLSHHTDKESQVPLVPSRARSNDELSYNSPSPINTSNVPSSTAVYSSGNAGSFIAGVHPTDRKEIISFYSPLAFTDDTMFTTLGHNSKLNVNSGFLSEPQSVANMGSNRNDKLLYTVLCQFCGQFHGRNSPHLYDYSEQVDPTLLCIICNQPLVEPIQANCGHTFCNPCLQKHLREQALCPSDRKIINQKECKEPPVIVIRLLDRLRVVCPNVDYCEEVLFRHELYDHLRFQCRGAVIPCVNAALGCTFQGSRNSFSTHQWECKYKDVENGRDPISNDIYNFQIQEEDFNESTAAEFENSMERDFEKEKAPIIEGIPSTIEIIRINQCDLGFSFVGGVDSPLGCIIIQEVYLDGLISSDGRLRPGDEIRMVNNIDLNTATHAQAKRVLSMLTPRCRMTIFRECVPVPPEHETFLVTLSKKTDTQLGIVLDKKKNYEGIYIRHIISASEASMNGRLSKGDRILSINDIDITNGTQEEAASIIRDAERSVHLIVQRRLSVPDVVKTTDDRMSLGSWSTSSGGGGGPGSSNRDHGRSGFNTVIVSSNTISGPHSEMISRRQLNSVAGGGTISRHQQHGWSDNNSNNSSSQGGGGGGGGANSFKLSSPDHVRPLFQPHQQQYPVVIQQSGFNNSRTFDRQWTQVSQQYQQISDTVQYQPDMVIVHKAPTESLCITVAGGINSHRGDIPIYVTNIYPYGVLSQYRKIRKGSVLLNINQTSLLGLTHREAVETLKRECYGHSEVTLHYVDGSETSSGAGNFMPSWKFWLQLPTYCACPRLIELHKEHPNQGLGFSIVGGVDSATISVMEPLGYWNTCVMIKTILPGSIAFNNGKLKCGDILLDVNNYPLLNVKHNEAVMVLKKTLSRVILRVVSWPGTIV